MILQQNNKSESKIRKGLHKKMQSALSAITTNNMVDIDEYFLQIICVLHLKVNVTYIFKCCKGN
eukprot:UN10976